MTPGKVPEGANAPRKPAKPAAKPAKKPAGAEGIAPGDEVYIRHPRRGALSVRVSAVGEHGFTGRCAEGERHRCPWDAYQGHRARMLHRYRMVEQGADGALLEDSTGRRRFVAGELVPPEPAAAPDPAAAESGDPILGGLDRLTKAEPMPRILFLKAGPVANRPGLSLQSVTDKAGHQSHRWERTDKDMPGAGRDPAAPAPMKHGDTVRFRHNDVEGRGTITASGKDGVTVKDAAGREHQVRHEALQGREPARPEYPKRVEGEEDKAYLKRIKDQLPDPDHLPEEHDRYFNTEGSQSVPLDQLVSSKSAAENEKGGNNSPKFMAAAYHGQVSKRDPISVKKRPDGKFEVTDGNGTLTGVQKHGWKHLPVRVEGEDGKPAEGNAAGGEAKPLFGPEDTEGLPKDAVQPTADKAELYQKSAEALEHLKDWLNKGKGVCSQMGHTTMAKSPEEVEDDEWKKPGGMLFIAPLKGQKRAAEKVEGKYGGDWSQLTDAVRCSIAVDTHAELSNVLSTLKAHGLKLAQAPKDRFVKPTGSGYRDVLMNVTFPNGIIGEIQLHTKSMLKAKNEGHHHYEIERVLDEKMKGGAKLSADELQTLKAAQQKQRSIYNSAWESALGGKGNPADLAKAMGGARRMGGQFKFFEHEGAKFRRKENGVTRSVDDVLHNGAWVPYQGGDALKPALFGDEIEDPLTAPNGTKPDPMAKAQPLAMARPRVLFLKAQIRGGASNDLFAEKVPVKAHSDRRGHFIAEHQATRKKHHAPTPAPAAPEPPMDGLPHGAVLGQDGRGLAAGKWRVQHPDRHVWSNFHDDPNDALAEARQVWANRQHEDQKRARQTEADGLIRDKLLGGEALTDADLKALDLKPRSAGFEWLSPVVQRLFGISKARVREAMGDAIRKVPNGMNTAILSVGDPRKALANAAAWSLRRGRK